MFADAVFDVTSERITAITVEAMRSPSPPLDGRYPSSPLPIDSARPVLKARTPSANPPPYNRTTIRFGYPEAIFSDPKRLSETNAINFYLALEWAIKNGFDYYDMGTSLGRPEDDLLQWKKRWGGTLDKMGNHGYFYIRLPKIGAAQFLWDAPLFSVEQNNMTLRLGLPDGASDEEAAIHYRKMSFGGLFKVYLHCARLPGERLLENLHNLYTHQKSPPTLECIPSD